MPSDTKSDSQVHIDLSKYPKFLRKRIEICYSSSGGIRRPLKAALKRIDEYGQDLISQCIEDHCSYYISHNDFGIQQENDYRTLSRRIFFEFRKLLRERQKEISLTSINTIDPNDPLFISVEQAREAIKNHSSPHIVCQNFSAENPCKNTQNLQEFQKIEREQNLVARKKRNSDLSDFLSENPEFKPFLELRSVTVNVMTGLKTLIEREVKRRATKYFKGFKWENLYLVWDFLQDRKYIMVTPPKAQDLSEDERERDKELLLQGFVHISSKAIKAHVHEYDDYLVMLEKANIIDIESGDPDPHYKSGCKTYYKIHKGLLKHRCVPVTITDKLILKRLQSVRTEEFLQVWEHDELRQSLKMYPRLKLPNAQAMIERAKILSGKYTKNERTLVYFHDDWKEDKRGYYRRTGKHSIANDWVDYVDKLSVCRVQWKLPNFSRSEREGSSGGFTRIYHVLSSLPEWIRQLVEIRDSNGSWTPIVEVDATAMHHAILHPLAKHNSVSEKALAKYARACTRVGGLHSDIGDYHNLDRNVLKHYSLAFLNTRIKNWNYKSQYKLVEQYYRNEHYEIFKLIKDLKKVDYKCLSTYFLKVESEIINPMLFMLDGITLHDGYICSVTDQDRGEEILNKQLESHNVPAKASVKKFRAVS